MEELLFTPAALLSLLSQIDELNEYNIGISESIDNKIQLQIGESTYIIETDNPTDISVSKQDSERVDQANIDAYEDLEASGEIDLNHDGDIDSIVEGGVIKEFAKTLLLGGMVRLSAKLLK